MWLIQNIVLHLSKLKYEDKKKESNLYSKCLRLHLLRLVSHGVHIKQWCATSEYKLPQEFKCLYSCWARIVLWMPRWNWGMLKWKKGSCPLFSFSSNLLRKTWVSIYISPWPKTQQSALRAKVVNFIQFHSVKTGVSVRSIAIRPKPGLVCLAVMERHVWSLGVA